MSGSIKSIIAVFVFAVMTVVAADALLGRIVVFPALEYETSDAIRDYKRGDPDALVLGSSYARSFIPFARWLGDQAPGLQMQVVPIEGGRYFAYDWLIQHRLAPLMDEADVHGKHVRLKLRHFVLVTNPWDACGSDDPYPNLPARAWGLGDYAKDLLAHGATSYNNNFIDQLVNEHTGSSALMRDRGHFRIVRSFGEVLRPKSEERLNQLEAERLAWWTAMLEDSTDLAAGTAHSRCQSEGELAALDRILRFATERHLDISLVLWPTYPSALSPALVASGNRFRSIMEDYAARYGARVVSLQDAKLLQDADFRKDFDHLKRQGDEKVRQWAATGPFRYLVELAGGQP